MKNSYALLALENCINKKKIAFFCFLGGFFAATGLTPLNFMPGCFIGFTIFARILYHIFQAPFCNTIQRIMLCSFGGWFFGFGYFIAGLWWIINAFFVVGPSYYWVIPFALFGLPGFLAIYWAFAGALTGLLWRNNFADFFALAFSFSLAEWLRSTLFTGFPWNSIGYTLMPTPLFMQSASIVGIYGVNVFAIFLYALPAGFFLQNLRKPALTFLITLFTLHICIGLYYLKTIPQNAEERTHNKKNHQPFYIRLVQPSILQTKKFDIAQRYQNLMRHIMLTEQPPKQGLPLPDLILWPETSVPYILSYNPKILDEIKKGLKEDQIALIGSVRTERDKKGKKNFYNSIEAVNAKGNIIATSDKKHLVPFGEYLPYCSILKKIGLSYIVKNWYGYSSAKRHQSVQLPNGLSYLPLICYEIIFPTEMGYEGVEPHFIVNVTNDAWYGRSPGPYQHLHQARIRAVEQRLPILRVANNGISAIIDPYGRVLSSLSLNEIGVIDAALPSDVVKVKKFLPGNSTFFAIMAVFLLCYFVFLCKARRH